MKWGRKVNFCGLPLDEWPIRDKIAWMQLQIAADPFDRHTHVRLWRRITRTSYEHGYRQWLGWLASHNELDQDAEPAARLTPHRVSRYVAELSRSIAPLSVATKIASVCFVVEAMTPGVDLRWLRNLRSHLLRRALPIRKLTGRVLSSATLFQFGLELMREAETPKILDPFHRSKARRAVRFRDGLMVALLASRPLRCANFVGIKLGENLIHRGARYKLVFPTDSTKTNRFIEVDVPRRLEAPLRRYLKYHRPVLLDRTGYRKTVNEELAGRERLTGGGTHYGGIQPNEVSSALWISEQWTAMSRNGIYQRLTIHTSRRFGVVLGPHLFRHSAATSIALEAPEIFDISASVLGHTSSVMTDTVYNHATSIDAGQRYHDVLAELRAPRRRPRKNI
jgi:integrase/recombinase XerD